MSCAVLRDCFAAVSIGAVSIAGPVFGSSRAAETTRIEGEQRMAVHQLRAYEIFESNKSAFHARFREHAARIMRRHGFEIAAMWEASHGGRTEFVYLLRWPDEATMNRRWERFMADEEWSEIKEKSAAEHGQLVGEIRSRVMRPTSYSPPF